MVDAEVDETAAKDPPDTGKRAPRGESRPFPRKTLTDSLKIVHAIKDQNAGKPFSPQQIADAIGRKHRSSDYYLFLSSSQHYGLTEGGPKASTISLTELGRNIAYPKSSAEETEAYIQAFLNVDLFRQVYRHYESNKLPADKFFRNALVSEFKINNDFVDEFIEIFEGNMRFLGVDTKSELRFAKKDSTQPEVGSTISKDESKTSIVRSGRHKAFVIMPFVEKNPDRPPGFFKEVFNSLIEPAAQAAGFDVEWANRAGSDIIQSTIINEILDADILIADLTDHNPNVLFELGLRLANNKGPTALLKSQDTGRLFDVDNLVRVYEYKQSLWKSTIEIDIPNLEEHIRATWENRNSQETYINILRRKT